MEPFTSIDHIMVGMEVVCVHVKQNGKFATIVRVKSRGPNRIEVRWNDGESHDTNWCYPNSFAPIDRAEVERMQDQKRRVNHAMKYL